MRVARRAARHGGAAAGWATPTAGAGFRASPAGRNPPARKLRGQARPGPHLLSRRWTQGRVRRPGSRGTRHDCSCRHAVPLPAVIPSRCSGYCTGSVRPPFITSTTIAPFVRWRSAGGEVREGDRLALRRVKVRRRADCRPARTLRAAAPGSATEKPSSALPGQAEVADEALGEDPPAESLCLERRGDRAQPLEPRAVERRLAVRQELDHGGRLAPVGAAAAADTAAAAPSRSTLRGRARLELGDLGWAAARFCVERRATRARPGPGPAPRRAVPATATGQRAGRGGGGGSSTVGGGGKPAQAVLELGAHAAPERLDRGHHGAALLGELVAKQLLHRLAKAALQLRQRRPAIRRSARWPGWSASSAPLGIAGIAVGDLRDIEAAKRARRAAVEQRRAVLAPIRAAGAAGRARARRRPAGRSSAARPRRRARAPGSRTARLPARCTSSAESSRSEDRS